MIVVVIIIVSWCAWREISIRLSCLFCSPDAQLCKFTTGLDIILTTIAETFPISKNCTRFQIIADISYDAFF